MADGLFLMQRYLGSDVEDSEDSKEPINKEINKFAEIETKKRKKSDSESKEANEFVLINNEVCDSVNEGQLENETILPKKKKRKKSNSEYEENIIKNNHILRTEKDVTGENIKTFKVEESNDQLTNKRKSNQTEKEEKLVSNADSAALNEENFIQIGQVKVQNKFNKPSIPKWMSNPTVFITSLHNKKVSISELDFLDENTIKNLRTAKVDFLFPVQAAVIPWLLESMQSNLRCLYRPSDLCVSAPTGSGKTLAFVIPIVQALKNRVVCAIRALVVLPVSELAFQVFYVFKLFTQGTNLKVCILTGQKSIQAERNALIGSGIKGTYSCVDIVVTTPGRILNHINKTEGFSLDQLQYLVIDEADRMIQDIQQGWLKKIEEAVYKNSHLSSCVCSAPIGKRMPYVPVTVCQTMYANEPLQKLLFSATLFHDPEKLHALSLYKPKLFTAQAKSDDTVIKCTIPEDLSVSTVICDPGTKPMALCHFIKEHKFKKVLCFTESVERAQRLHLILAEMGILQSREISSNNRPVQRKIILKQFAQGKVDVLVCSDLVARGLDIQGVDCVVSYDMPLFVEAFVHRIGRTARAGKLGTAVTLLNRDEVPSFKKLMKTAEIPMPKEMFIDESDLKQYIGSFKKALNAADSTIREMTYEKNWSNNLKKSGKQKSSSINGRPFPTESKEKTKRPSLNHTGAS